MIQFVITSIGVFIAAFLNLIPIVNYCKERKHLKSINASPTEPYYIDEKVKKRTIITVVILLAYLSMLTIIIVDERVDDPSEAQAFIIGAISMFFLLITALVNWHIILKKEKIKKPASFKIATAMCILLLCLCLSYFFEVNAPQLYYRFNTFGAKKAYTQSCIPYMEKHMQTEKIPDVKIKAENFNFIRMKYEDVPFYKTDLSYSSKAIDKYYDSAMKSKYHAKQLSYAIFEIYNSKNKFNSEEDTAHYNGTRAIVLFSDNDEDKITIKGNDHKYVLKASAILIFLYIDDDLVYYGDIIDDDNNITPQQDDQTSDDDIETDDDNYDDDSTNIIDDFGNSDSYYDDHSTSDDPPSKNDDSSSKNNYNSKNSYDEGYNAVWDDGDYDSDRYRNDWDYATGVDDALDELGEDF